MIELLLKIILLFTFGFGMGAMVLEFISSKREQKLKLEKEELISEIEKLNGDIKHLKERLSVYTYYFAADAREFKIIENFNSFDVVLKLCVIPPYREESVPIKRFYFKDDIEYARLCAQELLDALNNTN
jgi:hypothetical protein